MSSIRVILLFAFALVFMSCQKSNPMLSFSGKTMGSIVYNIKVAQKTSLDQTNTLPLGVQRVLDGINSQMSTYLKDSELSRFNGYKKTDWFKVSPELLFVLEEAQKVSEKTKGTFDVSVGPLVNLWGFGQGDRNPPLPSDEKVKQICGKIGYKNVEINIENQSIRKKIPDIYLDLSAIAKGYAVDQVAEYLLSEKIEHFMVEVGGELRTRGNKYGQKWKIGLESPKIEENGLKKRFLQRIVTTENHSLASSGDYRNFRYFSHSENSSENSGKEEKVRLSHTIDPNTGYPVTHNLASVTVVANNCMYADAMATAMMVLGFEAGFALAETENLACHFIIREDNKFREKMTSAFVKFMNATNKKE